MPTKILVVEDHADTREMMATILRGEGFIVACAEDGQAGLDLVETEHPDFIITDIQMPNLDGIALIKQLREHPQWSRIPVLVLSAYDSGILSDAMQAGATEAMHKPTQFAPLIGLIKKVLAGSSMCLCICTGFVACML